MVPPVTSQAAVTSSQQDRLVCQNCGVSWNVTFPSHHVHGRAADRLTELYEGQLSSRHQSDCRFATEARLYRDELLQQQSQQSNVDLLSSIIRSHNALPLAMAPLLPVSTRRLLQDMSPHSSFRRECKSVYQCLESLLGTTPKTHGRVREEPPQNSFSWTLRLPNVCFKAMEDGIAAVDSVASLLTRLRAVIKDISTEGTECTRISTPVEELAVALVIFGWSESLLIGNSHRIQAGSNQLHCCMECPFCLSRLELNTIPRGEVCQELRDSREGAPPPRKRPQRAFQNDPYAAHRYYCPYVYGFAMNAGSRSPETKRLALWQVLAIRLLQQQHPSSTFAENLQRPYVAYEQALQLLQSTVSPRLKARSTPNRETFVPT